MLSGEGNAGERWKATIGLMSKKATLHVQHTFLVHFFAVVLHDNNVKLPETSLLHVFWRKCRTSVSFTFFFTAAHFHLALVAASISHFVTAASKFSCCSSNKTNVSFVFSLVEFRWPAAYFLFFCLSLALYSKFVDMTINLQGVSKVRSDCILYFAQK